MTIPGYDEWKLAGPDDDRPEIGDEEGDTCGRFSEPDEDAPRRYRPKPCTGTMVYHPVENCSCHVSPPCGRCEANPLACDECGEEA